MTVAGSIPLTIEELADAIHSTDPTAFLVLPRVLRRVIKLDRRVSGFGLNVPHRKSYCIDRKRLTEMVDASELLPQPVHELPKTVLLLAQPDAEKLSLLPPSALLQKYWRLLFHLRIHAALEENFKRGQLTRAAIRLRVHEIGQTEFDEIRAVLRHEDFLLPPRDARVVYIEFAAVYLELKHFAPQALPRYFPAIREHSRVERVLSWDVDSEAVFLSTKLPGCELNAEYVACSAPNQPIEPIATPLRPCPERLYPRLMRWAERVRKPGNHVRSAILRYKASLVRDPVLAKMAGDTAAADLRAIARRLQEALELSDEQADDVLAAIESLLPQTTRARWTGEARLLYDLQKVCVDHEREISTVDLVEWIRTLGRRPIKRELPFQREVLMTKHLRSALHRLAMARMPEEHRTRLDAILRSAEHQVEERMRRQFRPLLFSALDCVGLVPKDLPERVGRRKLIEELLDRVAERGFLTMSDLRDALSRNNLKLPDLQGPGELLRGDPLLRCDRELAESMDGVYRRGEFYLRWLQRLSSLGFGNRWGRPLTKYLFLPFGSSYVALEGLQHIVGPLVDHSFDTEIHLMNPLSCVLVGFFVLLMLHLPEFRRSVVEKLKWLGKQFWYVFIEIPAQVRHLPAIRRVLDSRTFLLAYRLMIKPLVWTFFIWMFVPKYAFERLEVELAALAVFLSLSLFLNSSAGRHAEEVATDWASRTWRRVRTDILAGAFRLIMELFNRALETVERLLYAVDEWFRFKSGESRFSFFIKAIFGTAWFGVQYVIRFCVNLLIEPQINPIKHFPVVTVSHKIILPLTPTLIKLLTPVVGPVYAGTLGTTIVFSVPGIFGFLVWELKENWRLYAANRSKNLQPVLIGHHGETMVRFMRPGFHSGTLPKLYAKLRRAERKSQKTGSDRIIRKLHRDLHHVKESLHRFVERELLVLLRQSRCWSEKELTIGGLHASSNRVEIELKSSDDNDQSLVITFEEQSGKLLASTSAASWVAELDPSHRNALRNAIAGLYKLAGVDLVREQLQSALHTVRGGYDISGHEMVVWPEENYDTEVIYDLRTRPEITPKVNNVRYSQTLPTLRADSALYSEAPISWKDWVHAWTLDQEHKCLECSLVPHFRLLECPSISNAPG